MADSNITKRALASALKELMETMPFEKITISHICDKCCMNRKSFYYHFKDKYDLVNWIYDTEFFVTIAGYHNDDQWMLFELLCRYLYDNRKFYRKALNIRGQNSFSDHFRERLIPYIAEAIKDIVPDVHIDSPLMSDPDFVLQFQTNFMTDAIIAAIERWLQDKNNLSAHDFLAVIYSFVEKLSVQISNRSNE